MRSKAGS